MPVMVKTGPALKKIMRGRRQVEVEGSTVRELLERLGLQEHLCDGTGRLLRNYNIHINHGKEVRFLEGLETPVSDGDVVVILTAIAGG
jgi:molybdopterin synthase sulfur carrier subunit